jgi:hypothetical protein
MIEDGIAPSSYTSEDAAHAAGLSSRMLDYWRRTGLVRPAVDSRGSGHPVRWSDADLRYLLAVGYLYRAGIDVAPLRANPTLAGVAALCASVLGAIDDALAVAENSNGGISTVKRAAR